MKRVLFVCVENSCRSQMAEGFARALGAGVLEAASAGSRPSGAVNPKAIASMREAGIDISNHQSKGLDEVAGQSWDYAITMGCGDECPHVRAEHREDWSIPDPKHMPPEEFARVRDQIRDRVEQLLRDSK
jgi:arsenate reductase